MKKETIIIGVVVLLVAALVYTFVMSDGVMEKEGVMMGDEAAMMEGGENMEANDAMMASDGAMESNDAMMQKDDESMMAMSKGTYEAYAPEKVSWAEGDGKVVLFFQASWCPTCRALDADIKSSLNDIPAGVTILELDYDNSSDLKRKYGVTTQHTLVQVDANGELITKWSGGNTLESVVAKLK